jgi:hypothetical protein
VVDVAVNPHSSSELASDPAGLTVPAEHPGAAGDMPPSTPTAEVHLDADASDGRDERVSAQAAVDRAEARLIGACFGANSAAVQHWREVLDQAVDAYETAAARNPRTTR